MLHQSEGMSSYKLQENPEPRKGRGIGEQGDNSRLKNTKLSAYQISFEKNTFT